MVGLLNLMLHHAKTALNNLGQYKKVLVVLGNETCDLDSAVSSLVFGLLLRHMQAKAADTVVIPVFNIQSTELPIKTEVIYVLKKWDVNPNNIVCRDAIDLMMLQSSDRLEITLVDHHTLQPADLQLTRSVVRVLDHRPHDAAWPWSQADLTLRTVGSCCSLVAEKVLSQAPELVTPSVAAMLLGAILLDTACLLEAAGRATALDHEMANKLQLIIGSSLDKAQLFIELQAAKSDVSSLTTGQLLIKDFKVAAGIPITGLPMRVEEFLKRPDAGVAVLQFCLDQSCSVCVMYGSSTRGGVVTRDLAVYSAECCSVGDEIVAALTSSTDPDLSLEARLCSVTGFQLFEQLNIKHTRKQILPIIRNVGLKLNQKSR